LGGGGVFGGVGGGVFFLEIGSRTVGLTERSLSGGGGPGLGGGVRGGLKGERGEGGGVAGRGGAGGGLDMFVVCRWYLVNRVDIMACEAVAVGLCFGLLETVELSDIWCAGVYERNEKRKKGLEIDDIHALLLPEPHCASRKGCKRPYKHVMLR
jgi:hypothetical protein